MARILLLDDDIAEITAVKRLVARTAHRAQLATTAADAAGAIARDPPDLLVVASACDGGRALSVVREARASGAPLPVIVLGDAPGLPDGVQALGLPVDPEQLGRAIDGLLAPSPRASPPARSPPRRLAAAEALRTRAAGLRGESAPTRGAIDPPLGPPGRSAGAGALPTEGAEDPRGWADELAGTGSGARAGEPEIERSVGVEREAAAARRAASEVARARTAAAERRAGEAEAEEELLRAAISSARAELETLRRRSARPATPAPVPAPGPSPRSPSAEPATQPATSAMPGAEQSPGPPQSVQPPVLAASAPPSSAAVSPDTAPAPSPAPGPEPAIRTSAPAASPEREASPSPPSPVPSPRPGVRSAPHFPVAPIPSTAEPVVHAPLPPLAPPTPARVAPPAPAAPPTAPAALPLPPEELRLGTLAELPAPRLLALAAGARLAGRLDLEGEVTRSLWFEDGRVVGAASGDPAERVEALAVRLGLVTREQHQQVAPQAASLPARRAALLLLDAGFLKPAELSGLVRRRTEEVVFGIFGDSGARFRWAADEVPADERGPVERPPLALAVEGVRRRWSASRLDAVLGGPDTILSAIPDGPAPEALALSAEERQVAALADGLRTVAQVEKESPLDRLAARQVLAALVQIGALAVRRLAARSTAEAARAIDLARLADKLDQARRCDYFTVLGLPRSSTAHEVREAAGRLEDALDPRGHADGRDAPPEGSLGDLLQVVRDARAVLGDDGLRQAYLAALGE